MNLINIEDLTKIYAERKLFDGASFSLQDGEKIGVIGINGTGKTTLLRMIMGEEETDEGTVTTANHVVMRYLPQHPEFEPEKSSLECVLEGNVTEENRWSVESDARAMMMRLGIKDFMQPAGQLSGGQRKRLALISVLLSPADILLLDEPTNNLDIATLTILEDYLDRYDGIVVTVSHDRYFLDRTMKRIFAFEGDGKLKQYEGGYTDYVNRLAAEGRTPGGNIAARSAGADISGNSQNQKSEESVIEKNDSTATWKQKKKLKFSYKEQKEYETIEDDIAALEQKLEDLDNEMAANATNAAKLRELVEEKENAEKMLEEKMDRWEYLEELAAKIAGQQS